MASTQNTGRGYSHPGYAESLAEFGVPRALPRCGGWVLERAIAGTTARDLMGPYPLFTCADWSGLTDDVDELGDEVVSLVLVADPLADVEAPELRRAFPDVVRPFKRHFVCDLEAPNATTTHHRRSVRRAARAVEVETCAEPRERLDDWVRLYDELVARHGAVGISAFSRGSFRRQLALPGLIALRAERHGETVAMTLWLEDGPKAHYHLAASSASGYEVGANYALVAAALEQLRRRGVRWVNLGGVPANASRGDGLAHFKRGWANDERPARLCGRILNRKAYAELGDRGGAPGWFPRYRANEHGLAAAPPPRGGEAERSG
ncbi:MAG: GNAT family N-acetyltransferase [Actinobacteria bacterium]|nr:GNAT family N-acetyltransferase [Actinomycetota bacterium]